MVPMRMKMGNNANIIIKKIFQASEMAPLAIQLDEMDQNKKAYKILFKLNEHITGSDIFYEVRIIAEDDLDKNYIRSRSLYIDNIRKDEKRFEAFKNIMKDFDGNNFYVGDFNYEFENGNYYIDGYKQLIEEKTNRVFFESIRIYIPRFMLICISLYLQDLLDVYSDSEKEYLFASNEISNMRFEKVEELKVLGTCKSSNKHDKYFSYDTMYELSTGPTFWRFTYEILTEEDLEVKEIVGEEEFEAWYSKYKGNFIGIVKEPNNRFSYIVTKNDRGVPVALMTRDDLVNKTNLLDPYKIFVEEEEEKIEEPVEDEVTINNINTDDANSWNETADEEEEDKNEEN